MEGSSFTPARPDDTNNRASLRHLLSSEHDTDDQYSTPLSAVQHSSVKRDQSPRSDGSRPSKATAAMEKSTRRNKTGNISSVYSGNRISFLKKEDGEPFWRKDIQFLFLRTVFSDQTRVFTKASDGTHGHTFAEIYIDAMAKSSKCSQILKDKLLNDRTSAVDMAMICLLVNVGRMNTTLNFFPEMRARVRTYHSIPSLQAQQGVQAYKQLQDGPRLKSILKGATEDSHQPSTIEEMMATPKPRTNPVNLIFVLSQYAPKISEMHFFPPRDFFDIFIRTTLSSRSRATAFLWMIWWYLESDFSAEAARENPFGRGQAGEEGGVPIKVPPFDILSEEEAAQENVDTAEEIAFGQAKKLEREAILGNDMPPTATAPKRGNRTPLMDQQHNYRFRVSPYGSSVSGGSEGRGSPSPPPRDSNFRPENPSAPHGVRIDRDMTQSPAHVAQRHSSYHPSPDVSIAGPASVRGADVLRESRIDTPPASTRYKGVGRGNYPRKPKDPAVQPFEQVHRQPSLQQTPSQACYPGQIFQQEYQEHSSARYMPHLASTPDIHANTPRGVYPPTGSIEGYWIPTHVAGYDASLASSSKRRNPSAHQQALERSRRERINYLLYRSMRTAQRSQLRQHRKRGLLADAWIKCSALASGWNSEEDEALGRLGGINLVKKAEAHEIDDIGARSNDWAKALRKIGRKSGAAALIDRDRAVLRSRQREFFKLEDEILLDDEYEGMPSHEYAQVGEFYPAVMEEVVKEKKKPAKRRVTKGKIGEDGKEIPASAGRSARGKGIKRTVDGRAKAVGKTDSPSARGRSGRGGGPGSRGGKVRGAKRPVVVEEARAEGEDEEMDEMDRELLADVDVGGDETPGGSDHEHGGDEEEEGSDAGEPAFANEEAMRDTPDVVMLED